MLAPELWRLKSFRQGPARSRLGVHGWRSLIRLTAGIFLSATLCFALERASDWQAQVRKFAEAQDWDSALKLINREIARAPQDMDVRAWRARVLAWSGHFPEAEHEYLEILNVSRTDPDIWMGLANVYLCEGNLPEAARAIDAAEELDPRRADIRAARGRVLRAEGRRDEAQAEFREALQLDPASDEARSGLISVRGEPKHELRFGEENDFFNFTRAYHDESVSLTSQWTSYWATSFTGEMDQRDGIGAGKFMGSVTRRQPRWGALTVGGAVSHDNAVIPRSEAFFLLDRGWRMSETGFARSVEFVYGQHWYWYQSARILTLNGTAIAYFPREWTLSLGATGARGAFSGAGTDWNPSGMSRLGFPLARWGVRQLSGNVFFSVGTEDFGEVDQIGRFASQTYGSGLRFQFTPRQDATGYVAYQKRTQGRTDTSFGLSYGIHF